MPFSPLLKIIYLSSDMWMPPKYMIFTEISCSKDQVHVLTGFQNKYNMPYFAHEQGMKFEHKICPLLILLVPLALAMFIQDICKLPKSLGLYCSTLSKCGHHMSIVPCHDENRFLQKGMNACVVNLSPLQELGSKNPLYDLSLLLNRMQKYLLLWNHTTYKPRA